MESTNDKNVYTAHIKSKDNDFTVSYEPIPKPEQNTIELKITVTSNVRTDYGVNKNKRIYIKKNSSVPRIALKQRKAIEKSGEKDSPSHSDEQEQTRVQKSTKRKHSTSPSPQLNKSIQDGKKKKNAHQQKKEETQRWETPTTADSAETASTASSGTRQKKRKLVPPRNSGSSAASAPRQLRERTKKPTAASKQKKSSHRRRPLSKRTPEARNQHDNNNAQSRSSTPCLDERLPEGADSQVGVCPQPPLYASQAIAQQEDRQLQDQDESESNQLSPSILNNDEPGQGLILERILQVS